MNNYTTLYWITRLDALKDFSTFIAVVGIVIIVIYYLYPLVNDNINSGEETSAFYKKHQYKGAAGWTLMVMGFLMGSFIPNKNEAILILAGGATMNYIQKDTSLSKIGPQTTAIISQYLDSKLKELDKIGEKVKD